MEGQAEMGKTDKGAANRRCVCPDLGPDIIGGWYSRCFLQVGDVGDDRNHWEGVGQILPEGGPQANVVSTSAREGCYVAIPPRRTRWRTRD